MRCLRDDEKVNINTLCHWLLSPRQCAMWYRLSCRNCHKAPGLAKNTQYIRIFISNVFSKAWIWCCCLKKKLTCSKPAQTAPRAAKDKTVGYQHPVVAGRRVLRIPLKVPTQIPQIPCINADNAPNPPAPYTQMVPGASAKNEWCAYGVWLFTVQVKWCKSMGRLHSLRAFW